MAGGTAVHSGRPVAPDVPGGAGDDRHVGRGLGRLADDGVQRPEGTSFLPALLLPVTWELASDTLTVTVQEVPPAINPAWSRQVCRRTAWTEATLSTYLLGEERDAEFGEIAPRLAHALASLGGSCLRPAELVAEVGCMGEGIRNAAGLFLPDDSAFTRQTARDLDTLATWSYDVRPCRPCSKPSR